MIWLSSEVWLGWMRVIAAVALAICVWLIGWSSAQLPKQQVPTSQGSVISIGRPSSNIWIEAFPSVSNEQVRARSPGMCRRPSPTNRGDHAAFEYRSPRPAMRSAQPHCIGTPATLLPRGIVWHSAQVCVNVPTCGFEELPMPVIVGRGIGMTAAGTGGIGGARR